MGYPGKDMYVGTGTPVPALTACLDRVVSHLTELTNDSCVALAAWTCLMEKYGW